MELSKHAFKSQSTGRRWKILIAEDNEINREILRELLQDDYDIEEASDGNEAYGILKSKYRELFVILLDLVMPNCDGFQFMEKVKDDPILSNIPIVVLTGGSDKNLEAESLALGAVDFLTKPFNPAIVKAKLYNLIRMRQMSASLNAIEFDSLTGLYTKQAFYYHARELLDANPEKEYEIVISDIENFRLVNAVYGEKVGDALLKCLAEYSLSFDRGGVCGRYGADQIISIYPLLTDADREASRIKYLEFKKNSPVPNVVLKYGIYRNIDRTLPISAMCDRAMLALKSIKHNHTKVSATYDGPLSQRQLKAQLYEGRFREAIENREFVLWYQPKYDVYTKAVVGAEALVRWESPDGIIPPGEFLDVFEANGMLGQLDEYVFHSVCEYQKRRKDLGLDLFPISVNVSRGSFFRHGIVQRYLEIVNACGIAPEDVPLEITEGTAVASQRIKTVADALYEAGFRLHMDDFGSGHSSLNGLIILHFDVIKLDKSLIDHIGEKSGELILRYTMGLAKELGIHLVAEGVENEGQYEFLRENGCDTIQGYYFSKPLPVDAFEEKISVRSQPAAQAWSTRKKYALMSENDIDRHAMTHIRHCMPGGFFSYQAYGDEMILFSNPYVWRLFGCDSEQAFMEHVHSSFRGVVCPEELEQVEQSIAEQVAVNEDQMDYVTYHIVRKDGTRIPVVDYGRLIDRDGVNVFYVFIKAAEE